MSEILGGIRGKYVFNLLSLIYYLILRVNVIVFLENNLKNFFFNY